MTLPRPDEVRAAVATALLANGDLLDLLASNRPWNHQDEPADHANSIVPMFAIASLVTPYVGIMAGPMPKNERVSFNSFMYVRVYDSVDTDFILIDQIAHQIALSLDRMQIPMGSTVATQIDLEQMGPEATDEGQRQHYRELQFRLVLL